MSSGRSLIADICAILAALSTATCASPTPCDPPTGGAYQVEWLELPKDCPGAAQLWSAFLESPSTPDDCTETNDSCDLLLNDHQRCHQPIAGGFAWLRSEGGLKQTDAAAYRGRVVLSLAAFPDDDRFDARQTCLHATVRLSHHGGAGLDGTPLVSDPPGPECAIGLLPGKFVHCPDDYFCNSDGLCEPLAKLGEHCTSDLNHSVTEPSRDCTHIRCCVGGLNCNDTADEGPICVQPLGVGDACQYRPGITTTDDCASGLRCSCQTAECTGGECIEDP